MLNNITMKAKDAINAKLAEVYATIDGNRYNIIKYLFGNGKCITAA